MDEYKQYIHEKISQIPMHPTRMSENISIHISEAGFEAMKNDPEYEAWVLNDLWTGWAPPDRGADKKGAGKEMSAGRSQCESSDGKKRCTQAADVTVGKRDRIFRFRSGKIGGCGNSKCRL